MKRIALVRLTLRLPYKLHHWLLWQSGRSGVSLNKLIISSLSESIAVQRKMSQENDLLLEQVEHIRVALGDVVITLDADHLPEHIRPGDNLPDVDVFRRSLPELDPPLSATISADREDRW